MAYEGSVLYMTNAAFITFTSITMSYGKSMNYGGAIYADGTGAASITFANCASAIQYF